MHAPTLLPAPSRSPSPELLPSDDEGAAIVIPLTLRTLPSYYPSLPPKHTYQMTPVRISPFGRISAHHDLQASPTKKAALPSLEKKLKTAGLVQESLKNLMLATEDSANQEDGELLGHIVNWEVGIHPRKRWKTSRQ
jgi:transcription initiation factor TFIID subunit 8